MNGKSGPKRRGKGQETAETLMSAAIDLFAERDYASVTIHDITQRAGVAHSLIYYHFENKEDLFNKAVTNLIRTTIRSYRLSGLHHRHPAALIEDWLENNVRLASILRNLVKIMFDYSRPRSGSPSVKGAIRRFYREEHAILARTIAQGVEAGIFREVDPKRVAVFISTHIDGIFYDSFIRNDDDISQAMDDLRWVLWSILDYRGEAAPHTG